MLQSIQAFSLTSDTMESVYLCGENIKVAMYTVDQICCLLKLCRFTTQIYRLHFFRLRVALLFPSAAVLHLIQWVPDYPNTDYPNTDYPNSRLSERLDVAMFSAAAGKDVPVTGVLLQEKAKLLYERLFPHATTPFSASTGFKSRFTTS